MSWSVYIGLAFQPSDLDQIAKPFEKLKGQLASEGVETYGLDRDNFHIKLAFKPVEGRYGREELSTSVRSFAAQTRRFYLDLDRFEYNPETGAVYCCSTDKEGRLASLAVKLRLFLDNLPEQKKLETRGKIAYLLQPPPPDLFPRPLGIKEARIEAISLGLFAIFGPRGPQREIQRLFRAGFTSAAGRGL